MNIGIFADCYVPTSSGVVTSIIQLKEGLERRGHKVVVVTVDTPSYHGSDPAVYRFRSVSFNSDAGFRLGLVNQRAVNRIVQHERLDIVHTHTEFIVGWAAKRAARRMKLPFVHTAHTMYEQYLHYLFFGKLVSPAIVQRYLKDFLASADVLVCPSKKAQNYFKSLAPEIQTVVIGNGVDKIRFGLGLMTPGEREQIRQAFGIRPSDKVILYVGRMAKEKRVWELFTALVPLLQEHPHHKLLFVGRGPYVRSVRAAVEEMGLCGQVLLAGYVSWERLNRLYSLADLFVTASLSEVHPMTLIEASLCGLPIVTRRDDGYVGLVEDGYNGYLVNSDHEIADRLSELMEDETRLRMFSANGLTLSESWDAETHVEKLESLYQHLLQNRSREEWQ